MITDIKKLTVKYNGKTVGYLAQLDKGIAFQYAFRCRLRIEFLSIKRTYSGVCTVFLPTVCPTVGANFSSFVCWQSAA